MLCWRNLRLLTLMPKIHGIEDHLLDQIKKYNGIGCFIEDFIEKAHQFGMLDEKKAAKKRERTKASFSSSKNKTISNNGEVKLKIEQVRMQTRRKQIKRKPMDEKNKNKNIKRQTVRDECFEQCMNNNASKIADYNLLPRVNK